MEPARKWDNLEITMEYARVVEACDDGLLLETGSARFSARRAASCLVVPEPGDLALCSIDPGRQAYVLAVLEKANPDSATGLELKGDVRLNVRDGGLTISADHDLHLAARETLDLTSAKLAVNADEGEARVGAWLWIGQFAAAQVDKLRLVADSCDQVLTRLTQRVVNCFRSVEEHDEVQAGSSRYLVDGTMTVHAKNAVWAAEEDVKIDAEQIHLG